MRSAGTIGRVNDGCLARELGRLLRLEREHARLTQGVLADRAGVSQQLVSRIERGASAPTTAVVERLFGALRLQLRLDVEPLDAHLDESIEVARRVCDQDSGMAGVLLDDLDFLLRRASGLRYLIDGQLAAYLHGVPIQPDRIDLAVDEGDVAQLADWICSIPNCRRWDERWRDFSNYDVDPLRPGPLRWLTAFGELRIRLLPALPAPVTISVDGRDVPVRPLLEVERDEPQIERVARRVIGAGQSTVGRGGPSTSSASTIV